MVDTKMMSADADAQSEVAGDAGQSTPRRLSRRGFLGRAGGAAAATATAGTLGGIPLGGMTRRARAAADSGEAANTRADRAYTLRVIAARTERARPLPTHSTNGDEQLYATTRIGSFTKGLPHNALGEVDPAAYALYLKALESAQPADFEAIPLGGKAKFADPQGAYAFVLEGADSACMASPPPPAFSSAGQAGVMAEMYWAALARDIPFARYSTDPLIARAAADLSHLSDFQGPKVGGAVTPATLLRGGLTGEMTGPYISQFLWMPVAYGALTMPQLYPIAPPKEFLTAYDEWLTVQNGGYTPPKPSKTPAKPAPTRHMIAGRDLATFLHADFNYQAYLNAALILNKMLAPVDAAQPLQAFQDTGWRRHIRNPPSGGYRGQGGQRGGQGRVVPEVAGASQRAPREVWRKRTQPQNGRRAVSYPHRPADHVDRP